MAYGATLTLPTISGSHSNFPVVLRAADFPTAAIDGGGSSIDNGGGNLRAYTSDAKTTRLALHIVTFATGGTPDVEVWVKVPTAATGNTIYVEADAVETSPAGDTDTYGRNAVYVNDVARYHCDEASGNLTDSTGNGNTAVAQNSPTYEETGQIGDGVGVSNSGSNRFDITSTTDFDFSSLSSGYRIGLWMDLDASQPNWAGIIAKGDSANDFAFQRNSSTNGISVRHSSSVVTVTDGFNDFVGVGQVKLDLVWNKTHLNIYKDGALHSSTAFSDAPTYNATYPIKLGSERAGTCVNGTLDEIIFSKDFVPSADWLATEYDNQSASSNWVTVGTWSDGSGGVTLVVGDVAQAQSVDAPALTQGYVLSAAALSQAQSVDALALTQGYVLSVDALSQAQSVDATALTQGQTLALDEIDQAQTLDTPALTQGYVLSAAALAQTQSVDAPSLTQGYVLSADALAQAQSVDNADLSSGIVLVPAALAQAQSVDAPALTQANTLSIDALAQAQSVDATVLTQAHVLSVDALAQVQSVGGVTVSLAATLTPAGLAQAQTADGDVLLTQGYVLTPADLSQTQTADNVVLLTGSTLAVAELLQAQTVDNVVFISIDVPRARTLLVQSPRRVIFVQKRR